MDLSTELIPPAAAEPSSKPTAAQRVKREADRPRWWGAFVFVLYAWAFALPFWIFVAAVLLVLRVFPAAALGAALVGVFLGAPASITVRLVQSRFRQGFSSLLAGTVAAFVFAGLWWLAVRLFAAVPAAMILLAAGAFIAADQAKRWRNRRRDLRAARRFANPKTLAADQFLDSYLVLDALESAETALDDPQSARATLAWVRHQVTQGADPSARTPQPFRVAAGQTLKTLESRIAALKLPATFRLQELKDLPIDRFIEPLLLARMAEFAVHYAVHHERRATSELALSFEQVGETGFALLRTNLKRKDLWFLLPDDSGANAAKLRFVECLNQFAPGERLETGNDDAGNLFFRLSLKAHGVSTVNWPEVETQLPVGATLLSDCPHSDGMNRVYRAGDSVLKVARHSIGSPKPLSLEAEYHILRRLDGIAGAPQRAEFVTHGGFDVLSYRYKQGILLADYIEAHQGNRREWFRVVASLTLLLEQLHERGVAHRDLMPDNVLVDAGGGVHLIDFDQAMIASPDAARAVDLLGEARDGIHPCRAFVRDLLPALGLSEGYERTAVELRTLWQTAARSNANSPGQEIAYYRWAFGGLILPGERPWRQRWQLIFPAIQPLLRGARVLDLGCNMGMLSLHCLLHGAARVTGVDHEADIVECAARLASIAGVELNARHGDLNDRQFVAELDAEPYDLAIALSVVHWLENKADVMRLLARTPHVLFEGHLPPGEEIRVLHEFGFGEVRLIGYSERLRGMYLASNK